MILSVEPYEASLHIAFAVAPVALYFLLLGWLNTRRCPQMLTGRQDFALLTLAFSPLVVGPILHGLGGGLPTAMACIAALGGTIGLLAPRGRTFVIYNLPESDARQAVVDILAAMGVSVSPRRDRFDLNRGNARVEITHFPLLRNVSLRLLGGGEPLWREFETRLHARFQRMEAHPSPMAVSLLLVATGMLVAPLVLMLHHAPEIVRVLTDLLP